MLENLTVALKDPESKTGILDDWTWLIGREKRLVLLTAAGDAFVRDFNDGAIHFLNVSAGELVRIAETIEAFHKLLMDAEFVDEYLCPDFVEHMRAHGMVLKRDEIYSYRHPLSLGGEVTLENIEIANVEVHLAIAGQIARQIADLPDGARITKLDIKLPRNKPWWKFW